MNPKKINVTEKVSEIDQFMKEGNVHEAANLAIASLSSSEDDVGFYKCGNSNQWESKWGCSFDS